MLIKSSIPSLHSITLIVYCSIFVILCSEPSPISRIAMGAQAHNFQQSMHQDLWPISGADVDYVHHRLGLQWAKHLQRRFGRSSSHRRRWNLYSNRYCFVRVKPRLWIWSSSWLCADHIIPELGVDQYGHCHSSVRCCHDIAELFCIDTRARRHISTHTYTESKRQTKKKNIAIIKSFYQYLRKHDCLI